MNCYLRLPQFLKCLLFLCVVGVAQAAPDETRLRGVDSLAITVATSAFRKTKQDLQHFDVYVERHEREIEVIFVPDQPQIVDRTHLGIVGGKTAYGVETHYFVSKRTFEIVNIQFAR